MRLTILGSGTMQLTNERYPSAFLLEHNRTKILMDCGFGTSARLAKLGIDPRDLAAVAISHYHADHFGDGFNLVQARFVADLYEQHTPKKIQCIGPVGLEESFRNWRKVFWREPGESYPITFHEGPDQQLKVGAMTVETFLIHHVPWFQSVGFRVRTGGKTIAYPGDVGSDQDFDALVEECRDADLLLIEAGYPKPTPNHFTLEQAEDLCMRANVKQAILVHIKPLQSEYERLVAAIKDKVNFSLGYDLQVVEV